MVSVRVLVEDGRTFGELGDSADLADAAARLKLASPDWEEEIESAVGILRDLLPWIGARPVRMIATLRLAFEPYAQKREERPRWWGMVELAHSLRELTQDCLTP